MIVGRGGTTLYNPYRYVPPHHVTSSTLLKEDKRVNIKVLTQNDLYINCKAQVRQYRTNLRFLKTLVLEQIETADTIISQ